MDGEADFIDYYDILQVQWNCDATVLEGAYRHLAKMYHPDHPDTADVGRFSAVIDAYRKLRHPEDRARYDAVYAEKMHERGHGDPFAQVGADQKTAVSDAVVHEKILMALYKRRRESALDPGVPAFVLQEMLGCSDEHFEFHVWYLKSKDLLERTEQGTYAITIQGVDHVIALSRATVAEKEPIRQLRSA